MHASADGKGAVRYPYVLVTRTVEDIILPAKGLFDVRESIAEIAPCIVFIVSKTYPQKKYRIQ